MKSTNLSFFGITLSYLAFDIVLSALSVLSFFSRTFLTELSLEIYFFYASSVFVLYFADRLFDALSEGGIRSERDLFFSNYKRVLLMTSVLLLALSLHFYPPCICQCPYDLFLRYRLGFTKRAQNSRYTTW